MLELNFINFFNIYILFWAIVIFTLWMREITRNPVHHWALSEGNLCVCDKCHYAFLVPPDETVVRCQRCNEMCMIKRKRKWM